jgi:anti-anti-sigma factor
MQFEIHSITERGITILQPEGALDEATSPELLQAVLELLDQDVHLIVIDLAKASSATSHAFRTLLKVSKRLASDGGRLVVCSAQRSVAGALSLSGLARLCCVRDNRKMAVNELLVEERIERLAALVAGLLLSGENRRKATEAG